MKKLCCICKINIGVNKHGSGKICFDCSKIVYQKRKSYILKWHKENPDKVRAAKRKYSKSTRKLTSKKQDKVRDMVRLAIKKGLLIRGCCAVCNKSDAQAHHDNYNKPFDIKWFCSKHHREYEETNGLRKKKYS